MSYKVQCYPQNYCEVASINWIRELPENWAVLIFYLRPARRKARTAGIMEALCLLRDLHAAALVGGPLSEQGGLFWVALPIESLKLASARLSRLGYTYAVDLLKPVPEYRATLSRRQVSQERLVRWRKKYYLLDRLYEENPQAMRQRAPDRRVFLLETGDGEVRPVRGYRGDGGPLSRRGLPVYDARLLVNLVSAGHGAIFLDPFAGIGGIVLEALASGYLVVSSDWDPVLRHGLSHMGALHCVADARRLPFAAATFDAIATEPPYEKQAESIVIGALSEMYRVLKGGGRLAILCAAWQADGLRRKAASLGLTPYLDSFINRKGRDVIALAWQKGARP